MSVHEKHKRTNGQNNPHPTGTERPYEQECNRKKRKTK